PELGPMSVELLARRVAEHGEEHAAQIAETARTLRGSAGPGGCVFCAVMRALERSETCPHPPSGGLYRKVQELPASIAILSPDQFYRGYTLVVSRTHTTELFHLPDRESTQYLDDMLQVARAIATAFRPRKMNYELLGNTVAHLHWHLFPRYDGDPNPQRPIWEHPHAPRMPTTEEYGETIAAIRRQLG
ncbi:MAG: HIT family protein, partial [bacterium]